MEEGFFWSGKRVDALDLLGLRQRLPAQSRSGVDAAWL